MKKERLILVGPSGSGKDFLQRQLLLKDLRFEPKITTRPMRESEIDGKDYIFKTNEEFNEMLKSGQIFVYQSFSINDETWHYAITKANFDNNQLFIMTPHEISQINETDRKNCFVVYLYIDESIRKQRVLRRNDHNDSIERRFESDRKDFADFKDYDMQVTDPEFDAELIYDLMS